jgi:hypothetical protein
MKPARVQDLRRRVLAKIAVDPQRILDMTPRLL